MASSSSSAPMPAVPTTMFLPPLRLDRNNYYFWRCQVLPSIRAHDLEDILPRRTPPPDPYISEAPGSSTMVRNPAYTSWRRLDQFLLSWLMSSLSEQMIGHVVHCDTSAAIWEMLAQLFNFQSKARTLQLMSLLQTTKKGSTSVDEYMLKMKNYADGLCAAGFPITEDQLILFILAGLGSEYESVVVNLTSRDHLSLQEIQFMLQNHETRIEFNTAQSSTSLSNPTTNLAQTRKPPTSTQSDVSRSNQQLQFSLTPRAEVVVHTLIEVVSITMDPEFTVNSMGSRDTLCKNAIKDLT